jgi:hypothetical protein
MPFGSLSGMAKPGCLQYKDELTLGEIGDGSRVGWLNSIGIKMNDGSLTIGCSSRVGVGVVEGSKLSVWVLDGTIVLVTIGLLVESMVVCVVSGVIMEATAVGSFVGSLALMVNAS